MSELINKIKKLHDRPVRGSLTREMAMIIIGLVSGTVLLCWFLNTVFLEYYYVNNKQDYLLAGFETINAACEDGTLYTSGFDVTFDNLCANGNITVMIISADGRPMRSSVSNTQKMLIEYMDIMFGDRQNEEILAEEDNYTVQRRTDKRLNAEYLVLNGMLSDGNMILMRSALESIRESVKVSNQFLANIGILAVLVSTIVTVFVSRSVTTPLLELSHISRRMTELDFEAKYKPGGRRKNEIDELGEHMNEMSLTLERTISELKSANNQLLIDLEKKDQIDQMRREFLSNVSHELKTPLALIQGYAEGLRECINDDEESREFYCEVIMDEADKMNQMVKKLLTLNQLESGNETITMERFDLTELIQGILRSSEILLQQNGIKITACPKKPYYVWADEFMVEEVFTNYLSNAIHHADGDREIEIDCRKIGECVRISVFNTGKTIPEEDLEKVWMKFYKVDKARTREYGGSGIGLSIVKAIMESFHRECGVKNRENGVEFWFELDAGNH